jgi:hypothetical protein
VTELPLTPPAEEEEEEAAISSVEFSLHCRERKTAVGKFIEVGLTTFPSSFHRASIHFYKELASLFSVFSLQ